MQNVMCLNYGSKLSKVVLLNVKGRPFELLLARSERFRQLQVQFSKPVL